MATEDGGPAFPHQHDMVLYHDDDKTKPAQTIRGVWTGGMSLRDYFAAQALSVMGAITQAKIAARESFTSEEVATAVYQIADAMLKARKQ